MSFFFDIAFFLLWVQLDLVLHSLL